MGTPYVSVLCPSHIPHYNLGKHLDVQGSLLNNWVEFWVSFMWAAGVGSLALLSAGLGGAASQSISSLWLQLKRKRFVAKQTNKQANGAFKHLIVSGKTLPPMPLETKETKKWHMTPNRVSVHVREMLVWPLWNPDNLLTHLFRSWAYGQFQVLTETSEISPVSGQEMGGLKGYRKVVDRYMSGKSGDQWRAHLRKGNASLGRGWEMLRFWPFDHVSLKRSVRLLLCPDTQGINSVSGPQQLLKVAEKILWR